MTECYPGFWRILGVVKVVPCVRPTEQEEWGHCDDKLPRALNPAGDSPERLLRLE